MHWTPEPEQPEPVRYEPSKMGRVRVFTEYVFQVWGSGQGEQPTASVVDWHKRGEGWARGHVAEAVRERFPDAEAWIGRPTKETRRIRPYAGEQVEIPNDDEVAIF